MEKKKKDAFEEALDILKRYNDGFPTPKKEACCSGCEPEKKKSKKKVKQVQYEAEF